MKNKILTDENRYKWDTGEQWDATHQNHPTHHWENEHRLDAKHQSVKRLYMANKLRKEQQDGMSLPEQGYYIVEWAGVLRDIAALFLEGVGLVIVGRHVPIASVMMLVGVTVGVFVLRLRRHRHR